MDVYLTRVPEHNYKDINIDELAGSVGELAYVPPIALSLLAWWRFETNRCHRCSHSILIDGLNEASDRMKSAFIPHGFDFGENPNGGEIQLLDPFSDVFLERVYFRGPGLGSFASLARFDWVFGSKYLANGVPIETGYRTWAASGARKSIRVPFTSTQGGRVEHPSRNKFKATDVQLEGAFGRPDWFD